jgi:hypothetical protein
MNGLCGFAISLYIEMTLENKENETEWHNLKTLIKTAATEILGTSQNVARKKKA